MISSADVNMNSRRNNMGSPLFRELKKRASFFIREKIKTARLALTDVTHAQLLTEEATDENPWAPDTRTMNLISRAAFEIDDYWRIVEILHKRLSSFNEKQWREAYKALIVLEHLLTHGPESSSQEFQSDRDVINKMESFQYIDENGFDWGLNVRKKSEWVLKLLDEEQLRKRERNRARKLAQGIQGFGSFNQRSTGDNHKRSYVRTTPFCNQTGEEEEEEDDPLSSSTVSSQNSLAKKKYLLLGKPVFEEDKENLLGKEGGDIKKHINGVNKEKISEFRDWNESFESKPLLENQNTNSESIGEGDIVMAPSSRSERLCKNSQKFVY